MNPTHGDYFLDTRKVDMLPSPILHILRPSASWSAKKVRLKVIESFFWKLDVKFTPNCLALVKTTAQYFGVMQ